MLPGKFHPRILIVRLGAMGDILHALPAVTALRRVLPESWIGWAVEPQWTPLLSAGAAARGERMPVVDRLHRVPAKRWAKRPFSAGTLLAVRDMRNDLRAEHYDLAIDLQGAVRSACIGRMAGTKVVGEARPREPLARWLFNERMETTGRHVIEQARDVVAGALIGLGEAGIPQSPAVLPADSEAERWCGEWLGGLGVERFALMNPGAGWGAKRWPAERYAQVSAGLGQMGVRTVVNVGPGEDGLAEIICRGAGGNALTMEGDLGRLIACTRRARIFIGGDTGPLHLAAALKVPVVGIYGPTDPARNGPYETRARVLRHPESRRDHTRRSEPEAGLLTISAGDVLAAAQELLEDCPA